MTSSDHGTPAPRLLVVDDEPDVRAVLAETLSEEGYEARPCASVAEALAELAAAPCDLVLSDLRMPGEDGLALLRRVRQQHPGILFILMTAQHGVEEACGKDGAGADGFLQKPVTPDVLVDMVARTLRRA